MIQFSIRKRKSGVGKTNTEKAQTVQYATATNRRRVAFRDVCDEVARNTTFARQEVEAVLGLFAQIAKRHVEAGNIVDIGDMGSLRPSFSSKLVPEGEEFSVQKHITKPRVLLVPSKRYFTLEGVSFERVEPQPKKDGKDTKPTTPSTGTPNPSNTPRGNSGL